MKHGVPMSDKKKRLSMISDQVLRKKYPLLLSLSGVNFVASGSVSILDIQKYLLSNLPDILNMFPDYSIYFNLSTWLSFAAGLIFFLIPNTLTVWTGTYLIGASIFYFLSAAKGVGEWSYIAFALPYWIWVIAVLISDIESIKFYFLNTYFDGWILTLFKIAFLFWATINFIHIT
ncbi:MAG: hypothetical protein K9L59_03180 [Desulfobacterales bacterium]|nr:hypothetical protein [Desulfobacterales bacterium]